jgi:hypothetical protein
MDTWVWVFAHTNMWFADANSMTVNSKIKELNFCSNLRIFLLQLFSKVNIINKNLHMPGIQGSEAYSYKKHTSPLFLMTTLTDHNKIS